MANFVVVRAVVAIRSRNKGGMVSSIEIAAKEALEGLGENYHHQHRMGRFLVDFYLPDRNLVIEADRDYWHSLEKNKKNDVKKDRYVKEAQINLVRLKESDIRSSCNTLVRTALDQFPIIGGKTHGHFPTPQQQRFPGELWE